MKWWKDLSVSSKLYFVVGAMGLLIVLQLFIFIFAMNTLSGVRAFVAGEGHWSKSQKNAVLNLQNYVITEDENFYHLFLEEIKIPLGDRRAREELEKKDFNFKIAFDGLLEGKNHSHDIPDMIQLFRRFSGVSVLQPPLNAWREGDELFAKLISLGEATHKMIKSGGGKHVGKIRQIIDEISALNYRLTEVENTFSEELGSASRLLERFLYIILMLVIITVEGGGLFLTISFGRSLNRSFKELNKAADEVGRGNFNQKVPIHSQDEIGQLGAAINSMIDSLKNQIELQKAVKARDEFLSIASHELKTPLTTLKLLVQMRKRQIEKQDFSRFTPDKLITLVTEDENQINRLITLVDDMLDLSRLRAGKLEITPEKFELTGLAKTTLERLKLQLQKSGTPISFEAKEKVTGHWDPMRLEQVLINLLTNAVKYGKGKPVKVKITKNAREVEISVTDQGIGIAPEDQARIFEQFERAISYSEVSGLGLGLYISKQIIEAHGGVIRLESEYGKGSTFTVSLPLEKEIA